MSPAQTLRTALSSSGEFEQEVMICACPQVNENFIDIGKPCVHWTHKPGTTGPFGLNGLM